MKRAGGGCDPVVVFSTDARETSGLWPSQPRMTNAGDDGYQRMRCHCDCASSRPDHDSDLANSVIRTFHQTIGLHSNDYIIPVLT
jgi:hypothetical protein